MKRLLPVLLAFLLFPLALPSAHAADLPEDYPSVEEALPEEVREALPDGFFSGSAEEVGRAVSEALSLRSLVSLLGKLLTGGLGSAVTLFASLAAILALSALSKHLTDGLLGEHRGLSDAVGFTVRTATVVLCADLFADRLTGAGVFFTVLRSLMTALLPVMEFIYLSGGNGATAAVTNSAILIWLDLIDLLVSGLLIPACAVLAALAAADAFLGDGLPGFGPVSALIRQTVGFVLGLGATLLAASLGTQTVIASAGDTVSAKTVKYMAGNMIPVVGSTVGDALRALAASAKLLRATVGGAGIAVLAAAVLPVTVSLLLSRLAIGASAAVGELLGCRAEVRFLREAEGIFGLLLAAAVICSLLLVFALTVFALTASAAA